MLIANAEDGKVLLFGLSRENIRRLQAGSPIRASRDSHGLAMPEGVTVMIVAGETEQEILTQLQAAGVVDKSTVLNQKTSY